IGFLSIFLPRRLVACISRKLAHYPVADFPDLFPAGEETVQRSLRQYRLLNTVVAVAGLVLLAMLASYMQQSDWDDGPVEFATLLYFMLQLQPLWLYATMEARFTRLQRILH